ncbi:hypothetical protein ASC94_03195 [Massilia sp. Root418]|nr:hypothetical protein ASC94_03195 [Massilia sp. Root418]
MQEEIVMLDLNPSFTYDDVTRSLNEHIEFTASLVRDYRTQGKPGEARLLANSLSGAFALWERITRGQQRKDDALRLEQAIGRLQAEATPG